MRYIGIDVGGTNLKAGLVDESGLILASQSMKIPRIDDQDSLAWTLVSLTQELCRAAGVGLDQVTSVGVGVPGTVDVYSGSILYTCNLSLKNVPLRKLFRRYLSLPLYIENDANCAALAEYFAGAGRGSKRFVTITLGTGIGAGIIHNGKIYHGSNGMAGEVGHMTIFYQGEPAFSEQDLFYLTRKTVMELTKRGAAAGVPRLDDLCLPESGDSPRRFFGNPPLAHLERSLSRHPRRAFEGDLMGRIRILEAASPEEEVRQTCILMKKLIAEKGYSYRDFALICGDLETYGDLIVRSAQVYGIPVYVDQTRRVIHNPLTEAVRSLLQIGIRGFDYENVFRYLRSGISSLTREETDILENYCLEHGIRGRRKWSMPFDAGTEPMRRAFLEEIAPLEMILLENETGEEEPEEGQEEKKKHVLTVGERTRQIYDWMTGIRAAEKMDRMAEEFEAAGDVVRQKEYSQLYGSLIELLDQLYQYHEAGGIRIDEVGKETYAEVPSLEELGSDPITELLNVDK